MKVLIKTAEKAVETAQVFLYISALSSTGSILSNTDLSDLSTVGTCDIFVYQCVTESCDSPDWLIQYCLSSASSRVTERFQ